MNTINDLEIEKIWPLYSVQKGMLFHSTTKDGRNYFHQLGFQINESLDVEAFENSWKLLIKRHEIFRTAFIWNGQTDPKQVVFKEVSFSVEQKDWQGSTPSEIEFKWNNLLSEDLKIGIHPNRAPLMRVYLISMKGNEKNKEIWRILWSHHHLITDGWSLGLTLFQLFEIYNKLKNGQNPTKLAVKSFGEFANEWHNKYGSGKFTAEKVSAELFWKNFLSDYPGSESKGRFESAINQEKCETLLSREKSLSLQLFTRKNHITLSILFHAAWAITQWLKLRSTDIAYAISVSGRPEEMEGADEIIGPFINTLPFRVVIDPNKSIKVWLTEILNDQNKVIEFQHTDLSDIIKWAKEIKSPISGALDQLLIFENYPLDLKKIQQQINSDLSVINAREFNEFPFIFQVFPNEQIKLEMIYLTNKITKDEVQELIRNVEWVLDQLIKYPESKIKDINWKNPEVIKHLLVDCNSTDYDLPLQSSFEDLFDEQVRLHPNQIAVICANKSLSYLQLQQWSNGVAVELQHRGVDTDLLLALFAHRDERYLVVILGIFKAGGAYLPLDPDQPIARIKSILNKSNVKYILKDHNLSIENLHDNEMNWDEILHLGWQRGIAGEKPHKKSFSKSMRYVMFTSGSTGVPKGAMVEQIGMLNHLYLKIIDLEITKNDCIAQNASQCFDISVWQFLSGLLQGGKVSIISKQEARDPELLLMRIVKDQVTILETVPSLLHALLENIESLVNKPQLSHLRCLVLNAEVLTPELSRRWFRLYPLIPLVNAYGTTETSDDVCHYWMREIPSKTQSTIPIGKPLVNSKVFILNSNLEIAMPGEVGEIFIGGPGVGRGYLGEPQQTAKVFIPDHLTGTQGARLYKTGDLAKYRGDGTIDYLGRKDQQVKIRGFRVELSEVELTLQMCPGIELCAVLALERETDILSLVAFIFVNHIATKNQDSEIERIRSFLIHRLPEPMVPTQFIFLENFPLNENGKIDRKSLRETYKIQKTNLDIFDKANTHENDPSIEKDFKLKKIWKEVLKRSDVESTNNFFQTGGDSISALQLVVRCKKAGILFSVRDVFENPVLKNLTRIAIQKQNLILQTSQAKAIKHNENQLSAIQKWFFSLKLKNIHHWNQAFEFDFINGKEADPFILKQAIVKLVEQHPMLRARFWKSEDGWKQKIIEKEEFDFYSYYDFSFLTDAEFHIRQVRQELQTGLNLESGPLIRVAYFKLPHSAGFRIFICIHHLVIDPYSWEVLINDLENILTDNFTDEERSEYFTWINSLTANQETQIKEIDTESNEKDKPYIFDFDHNEKSNIEGNAIQLQMNIDKLVFKKVFGVLRSKLGLSSFELALGILAIALSRWTGSNTHRVFLELDQRKWLDELSFNKTIGWFGSLVPIILKHRNQDHLIDTLHFIQENLRQISYSKYSNGIHPNVDLVFNFTILPSFNNSRFKLHHADTSDRFAIENHRPHLLEIDAVQTESEFELYARFTPTVISEEKVFNLLMLFKSALTELAEMNENYDMARLNADELDLIINGDF